MSVNGFFLLKDPVSQKMHKVSFSSDQMPNSPPHLGQVVMMSGIATISFHEAYRLYVLTGSLSFAFLHPSRARRSILLLLQLLISSK